MILLFAPIVHLSDIHNIWFVAAAWMALALIASLLSIRIGLSVALAEILIGVLAGNFLDIATTPWIDFLATFGSGLLTFLAGAEIDPESLRRHLKPSLVIGVMAFLVPFAGVLFFASRLAGWDPQASQIAAIALSTTSVAVVYAVMVETGLNQTELGKLILAACFINDFGTVLALGILFANFNVWLIVFIAVTAFVLWNLARVTRWVLANYGNRVSEPEIKFLFLVLFLLGGFATQANSEAVLPAYLVGLAIAGTFLRDRTLAVRMRSIAFALLTPFYFLKAGLYVSLPAVASGIVLIVAFLLIKIVTKIIGVWPLTRAFRMGPREGAYTTLLMSTGLTFGTISALFGLTNHIIDQEQYTILVTVVIGSAIVPTMVAQTFFRPSATEVSVDAAISAEVPAGAVRSGRSPQSATNAND